MNQTKDLVTDALSQFGLTPVETEKPLVYFVKGKHCIQPKAFKDYVVKVPTVKYRLHKQGTTGLDRVEDGTLKKVKGLLYVDATQRKYYVIPTETLLKYPLGFGHACGAKNSIVKYDVKKCIEENNIVGVVIK